MFCIIVDTVNEKHKLGKSELHFSPRFRFGLNSGILNHHSLISLFTYDGVENDVKILYNLPNIKLYLQPFGKVYIHLGDLIGNPMRVIISVFYTMYS